MNSHKNKTIDISADEYAALIGACIPADSPMSPEACIDKTLCGDAFDVLGFLPRGFFDLLIADPPYNLDKTFDGEKFRKTAVKVSEQDIREFYEQALREEPKKLINCLVKEIVLFDDRMEICFNSPIKKSPDESRGFSFYNSFADMHVYLYSNTAPQVKKMRIEIYVGETAVAAILFMAEQRKKPNPNTFSSIRFRLSLAHHEEFESPTFGSVDQRSIQLS